MYGRISNAEMGNYSPRGALALCMIPSHSGIGRWSWGFHIVWGGFDLGDQRFRPRVVELQMHRGILNRGWGQYILPRCGDIVGFPRGQLPPSSASPPDWPRADGGGAPRPIGLGLGKRWDESHLPIILYNAPR